MITLDAGIFGSPARHSDCAGVLVVRSSHSKHCYAASLVIARSNNRKNRVLRVPDLNLLSPWIDISATSSSGLFLHAGGMCVAAWRR